MPQEILSVAVWEPVPDMEVASLETIRELISVLAAKGYSRDLLYRDPESHFVLIRYWRSEEARRAAQEDADAQRCWAKLAHEIQILRVYEKLEVVPLEAGKTPWISPPKGGQPPSGIQAGAAWRLRTHLECQGKRAPPFHPRLQRRLHRSPRAWISPLSRNSQPQGPSPHPWRRIKRASPTAHRSGRCLLRRRIHGPALRFALPPVSLLRPTRPR